MPTTFTRSGTQGRGLFQWEKCAPFSSFLWSPVEPCRLSPTPLPCQCVTTVQLSVCPGAFVYQLVPTPGELGPWVSATHQHPSFQAPQRYVVMKASETYQRKDSSHKVTSNPDFGKTISDLPL